VTGVAGVRGNQQWHPNFKTREHALASGELSRVCLTITNEMMAMFAFIPQMLIMRMLNKREMIEDAKRSSWPLFKEWNTRNRPQKRTVVLAGH
jgi:hypothetical protein